MGARGQFREPHAPTGPADGIAGWNGLRPTVSVPPAREFPGTPEPVEPGRPEVQSEERDYTDFRNSRAREHDSQGADARADLFCGTWVLDQPSDWTSRRIPGRGIHGGLGANVPQGGRVVRRERPFRTVSNNLHGGILPANARGHFSAEVHSGLASAGVKELQEAVVTYAPEWRGVEE